MKIEIHQSQPWGVACDALIIGVVEGSEGQPPWTVELNRFMGGAIAARLEAGDLKGGVGEVVPLAPGERLEARRLLVTGLGKADRVTDETLRRATGAAVRWLEERGGGHAATLLAMGLERRASADRVHAVAEAAELAAYRGPAYGERAKHRERHAPVAQLDVIEPRRGKHTHLVEAARRGAAVARGSNAARHLAELPSNLLTPKDLAQAATDLLRDTRVAVTVHDEKWIRARQMGALLGVAQGSSQPPRFIVMQYRPRGATRHVVLVGKGITFDTGGISLKPRDGMDRMKYDMSGAAGVIGAMVAVAGLEPSLRVTGLVPTAENMPDGKAIKPGDVLMSAAGKSIEVLNTDAEGRLILADALDHGRRMKPDVMIDMATLTGACKVALGDVACGIMGNDGSLVEALHQAGIESGELAWPLPLLPEHDELVRGTVADLRNAAGRWGGALTAGAFLKPFAGETPWAHIDIAGVAWNDRERHYLKKGSTGFGVRLLAAYLGL
ncbi:MAG: leucyl aminopeptidase [Candidatus Eiseniibacteriota bacterium]